MLVILPTCPKCGCHDIRSGYGSYCFKCNYIFPPKPKGVSYILTRKGARKIIHK